MFATFDVSA